MKQYDATIALQVYPGDNPLYVKNEVIKCGDVVNVLIDGEERKYKVVRRNFKKGILYLNDYHK